MTPLFAHQKKAIERAINYKGFGLFLDPGLGKTRACLEIFAHHRKSSPELKLLVVCPKSLIGTAWKDDIEKFTTLSFISFKQLKNTIPDIVAINYESLIQKHNYQKIKDMVKSNPYMCILDESSRLKSPKSITTKLLLELAQYFRYKIVASGSPMPNSELELWSQVSFISDVLPHSFYAFRNIYFQLERGGKFMQGQTVNPSMLRDIFAKGWKYSIIPEKRKELMRKIAPFTEWVKKSEALDLPETITQVREVELSPPEIKAYKEMKNDLITEIRGETIAVNIALAKLTKTRQIASGFLYNEGVSHEIGKSKFNELKNILEELGNQPVIIWAQFKYEIEQIANHLGDKAVTLYSEIKDHDESIRKFKSGEVQYLVAHPRSAGHGLTLTNCSTMIFYSLDFSEEMRFQAEARIHRISQTRSCLYIYILAKATVDFNIYRALNEKKSLNELILDIVKEANI